MTQVLILFLLSLLFISHAFIFRILNKPKTYRYIVRFKIDNHAALSHQYFTFFYTLSWKQAAEASGLYDYILTDIIDKMEKARGIKVTTKDISICFISLVN